MSDVSGVSGPASGGSAAGTGPIRTVAWLDGVVELIDQRRLPLEEVYLRCETWQEVAAAIREMAVRGAPAIGVTAAMGMALAARAGLRVSAGEPARYRAALQAATKGLGETRPTANNLFWALAEMQEVWDVDPVSPEAVTEQMERRALEILADDVARCRAIGDNGAALIQGDRVTILTHCNAGALATAGYGTALGVVRSAYSRNPRVCVLVDETRPLLQGARLTAWELTREGIPMELITDNMAGSLMRAGVVTHVVVGADRIAANGDVANKIGTYGISVLAKEHGLPFYVAAPLSTYDPTLAHGGLIPIEERDADEVTGFGGLRWAPLGIKVRNPAFDVTPAANVTGIITERGVAFPPYEESLKRLEAE
jgi:methylthioribose-1-phosphate isomerase